MYIAFLKPGPQRAQADQWAPAPIRMAKGMAALFDGKPT